MIILIEKEALSCQVAYRKPFNRAVFKMNFVLKGKCGRDKQFTAIVSFLLL